MFGPCLTPYQPKAGLEYTAISLIHWRIIIHRAGIHLKGKKQVEPYFVAEIVRPKLCDICEKMK